MAETSDGKILRESPLSPHISIYKPQITSILSISHRITGLLLFFGALILSWSIVIGVYSEHNEINGALYGLIKAFFGSIFGKIAVFGWSFCLFYHLLNGIRHLFWDIGKGFQIKTVNITGIFVVVCAIFLTALSWYLVL